MDHANLSDRTTLNLLPKNKPSISRSLATIIRALTLPPFHLLSSRDAHNRKAPGLRSDVEAYVKFE